MTFAQNKEVKVIEKVLIKPSEVYNRHNKDAVLKALEGFSIVDFRLPNYGVDSYLPADFLRVEGPFFGYGIGKEPRFIVKKKQPVSGFPEWE